MVKEMGIPYAINLKDGEILLLDNVRFLAEEQTLFELKLQLNHEQQAQTLLGSRAIFRDDSVWLTCLSAHEQGATVRSLFAGALESVFAGEMTAETALERAQAALDALQ